MSAIYLDNMLLHYEVFGRGQPIIFLHSWLGSWRYWVSTMDDLSDRYRTYALDFWGFGESERERGPCTLKGYVDLLRGFMDKMGIAKANLVGHGMGGMVAITAVGEDPGRFLRLAVVSTPIDGMVLREVVKPGTFSRLLGRSSPTSIWVRLLRQIPVDDPEVQKELYEDTDSLSEQVIQSVQDSIMDTNLQSLLSQLDVNVPLLAIYGEKDMIIPPDHARFMDNDDGRPHQLLVMPRASHFPFLEETNKFNRLIRDFLESKGTPVEIKEQWRRRVSQHEYL